MLKTKETILKILRENSSRTENTLPTALDGNTLCAGTYPNKTYMMKHYIESLIEAHVIQLPPKAGAKYKKP